MNHTENFNRIMNYSNTMEKLTFNQKKEALTNALKSYQFNQKYFIQNADARLGHKFAIASNTPSGGIEVCTNFFTYEEMNAYLMGYNHALMMKFKNN